MQTALLWYEAISINCLVNALFNILRNAYQGELATDARKEHGAMGLAHFGSSRRLSHA